MFKKKLVQVCGTAVFSLFSLNMVAQAATYPSKPIIMVVPFAPGGATDQLGRLLGEKLGKKLGQTVIIENRPGAGTVVAAAHVARANPDGYTLFLSGPAGLTLNPVIRSELPYDPLTSYDFISRVASMDMVLLGNSKTSQNTLKDIVQTEKDKPGSLTYGSFGVGSPAHFGGEMLNARLEVDMLHIPFNGSTPNLTALMGNQIPLAVDTVVAALPQIKAKNLNPIAVMSSKRISHLPDVPTVAESGYPDFEIKSWFAMVAPKGLAVDVQKTLDDAFREIIAEPNTHKKLQEIGLSPDYASAAELKTMIEEEIVTMGDIAQRAGIKAD